MPTSQPRPPCWECRPGRAVLLLESLHHIHSGSGLSPGWGCGNYQSGDVSLWGHVTRVIDAPPFHLHTFSRAWDTSFHLVIYLQLTAPRCHCPWLPCKGSCWTEAGLSYWHMALWSLGVRGAAVPPAPCILHSSRDTSSLGNRHTIKYGKSCKNHLVLESKLMNNIDA